MLRSAAGGWLVLVLLGAQAQPLPPVVVYAPSPCLSCIDWAEHLRRHGFTVTLEDKPQAEMPRIKRWLNVPSALESVHTARIDGYFIEGHVPAEDILMLLKERPKARECTRRASSSTPAPSGGRTRHGRRTSRPATLD